MQRGSVLPLIIIFLVLLLSSVGIATYYKLQNGSQIQQNKEPAKSLTETQVSQKETTASEIPDGAYETIKPKQFTSNDKFFREEKYPDEVINLQKENLIEFKCTSIYREDQTKPLLAFNNMSKLSFDIKEALAQQFLTAARANEDAEFTASIYCKLQNDQPILLIGQWYVEQDENIRIFLQENGETIKISSKGNGAPYFNCEYPFIITKTNEIYIQCGGGDGGLGMSSIFKISLNEKTITNLKTCKFFDDPDTPEPAEQECY